MRRLRLYAIGLGMVLATSLVLGVAWLLWPSSPVAVAHQEIRHPNDPARIERGRQLSLLGNCMVCHTGADGLPYAGGHAISTPFGTVYGPNLTPSATGLGLWSADDFWRALHHGQAPDGRLLSPVFPYPNTTHISREDSDDLWIYLRSLPAVDRPSRPPDLAWPYHTQAALKVWRLLYFSPAKGPTTDPPANLPAADAALWQRGQYLVQGLGHCSACHVPRNGWGGHRDMLDLSGGLMPGASWYAPSLYDPAEGGVQSWTQAQVVNWFRNGRHASAWANGPMADVVFYSTQHWARQDLESLAVYLRHLPIRHHDHQPSEAVVVPAAAERLYRYHCADCHGQQGEGGRTASGVMVYPPLAGNRSIRLASPANLLQMVRHGGFGPATTGRPQPYGMPPFRLNLNDAETAAILTYLRRSWGNQASGVTELDIQRLSTP